MTSFIEANVARQVVDLCKWIGEGSISHVGMDMSLSRDLGFDSMKLMQFFAGIEDLYAGIALEDWFIAQSSGGRDTVGSVVRHVAGLLPRAAAE